MSVGLTLTAAAAAVASVVCVRGGDAEMRAPDTRWMDVFWYGFAAVVCLWVASLSAQEVGLL